MEKIDNYKEIVIILCDFLIVIQKLENSRMMFVMYNENIFY